MKNNFTTVILVILIGVLSGVGLLFGIGNAVAVATTPLVARIESLTTQQMNLERKLNAISAHIASSDEKITKIADHFTNQNPSQPPAPPVEDLSKVYEIPVDNSVVIGPKQAPVTIVQFTDLQCPFCNRFYPPVKEVLKAYPDKVNFIVKHFPLPFHPNARPAAKLAMAANEQGKFADMVELLLTNQADVSEEKTKEYAKKLGIKHDKLMADLKKNDAKYEAIIEEDMKLVEAVDVRGTPTFFINGKKTMARDFNGFKAEIDQILASGGQK